MMKRKTNKGVLRFVLFYIEYVILILWKMKILYHMFVIVDYVHHKMINDDHFYCNSYRYRYYHYCC